jgi:hypothetical protein
MFVAVSAVSSSEPLASFEVSTSLSLTEHADDNITVEVGDGKVYAFQFQQSQQLAYFKSVLHRHMQFCKNSSSTAQAFNLIHNQTMPHLTESMQRMRMPSNMSSILSVRWGIVWL